MERNSIAKLTIKRIKEITNISTFIDDDLLLFDRLEDLPFPLEPRKMN